MQIIKLTIDDGGICKWVVLHFDFIDEKKRINVDVIRAHPKEKELIKLLFFRGMYGYNFKIYNKRKIIQILEIINILYGKISSVQFVDQTNNSIISPIDFLQIINKYLYE